MMMLCVDLFNIPILFYTYVVYGIMVDEYNRNICDNDEMIIGK